MGNLRMGAKTGLVEFDFASLTPARCIARKPRAANKSFPVESRFSFRILEVVMASDPSVLAAILAAVEANPENMALRLHLVTLLLTAKQYSEALPHCAVVLNAEPDNVEALRLAAQAAEGAGDSRRADSYRRLAQALAGDSTASAKDRGKEEELWPDDLPMPEPKPPAPPLRLTNGPEAFDLAWESEAPGEDFWEAEKPELTLTDVAGMVEVKRRLNLAFLGPLKNPELMRMYGKSLRGGLLMYGPPGCGKTHLARATAGEVKAGFFVSEDFRGGRGEKEAKDYHVYRVTRLPSDPALRPGGLGRRVSQRRPGYQDRGIFRGHA
mgnify:CR=1 FL=1